MSLGKLAAGVIAICFFTAFSVYAAGTDPDADYDRLDGSGTSGEKVQVIEWEGNLEVHVYPQGSLKGLGLKLDNTNKYKPVMVLSYRFGKSKPLIRRAILGIDLHDGFKVYQDPGETEFDKIIITMNTLGNPLLAYNTDPAPTQLYPDGVKAPTVVGAMPTRINARAPAAVAAPASADDDEEETVPAGADENGRITPFFMRPAGSGGGRGH